MQDSEPSYVATANHKFRTITTMLYVFQRANKGEVPPILDLPEAKERRRQRKLLSALATLFVRDTEVVAVASVTIKPYETSLVAVERVARVEVEGGADTNTNTDDTQALQVGSPALPFQYIAVSNAAREVESSNASPKVANNVKSHPWCERINILRSITAPSEIEIITNLLEGRGKPPG